MCCGKGLEGQESRLPASGRSHKTAQHICQVRLGAHLQKQEVTDSAPLPHPSQGSLGEQQDQLLLKCTPQPHPGTEKGLELNGMGAES